jgi:hypothetical protein
VATLALGLAGAAVGNMFGFAAAGFTVGSALGDYLFAPGQKAEGPRLGDLRVQGSAYGTPIPEVYGAARLAGQRSSPSA